MAGKVASNPQDTHILYVITLTLLDLRDRTYEYMPPELLEHAQRGLQSPYDPRAVDVWSSGVMLTLMLFGKKPFTRDQGKDAPSESAEQVLWCV